ncbi:MAG: ABC transporter permease [Bowdeniella nasicola]|nr:ABC transporter permease [Bowdeniella nasicola]
MKLSALLRAVRLQFWADLRPNLVGLGLISTLFTPALLIGISKLVDHVDTDIVTSYGTFMVAGMFGGFAGMVGMQIMTEMYSERYSGNLLRIRTLPHGSLVWACAKTASASLLVVFMMTVLLIGGRVIIPGADFTAGQILLAVLALILIIAASAPLGFIVGSFVNGVYSMMISTLVWLAVLGTSGGPFPLDLLPGWLQAIQRVGPFYWGGHLARSILLPQQAGASEVTGSFAPGLAILILVAWMIGGFVLAIFLVNTSLKKQSISSLEKIQSTMRAQTGM